jgi:hypothetical protein
MEERDRIKLITKIIERAENMGFEFDRMTLNMDLRFVDDSIGLRLEDFLDGTDDGFAHDILGIQKNFNRETKEMDNFFLPRFAKSE